jgi:uncharacterized protein YjbI with pentapeptide repeats
VNAITSNRGVLALSEQQTVPTTSWWKNKKIIIRIVLFALLVVIVFIVFIAAAYTFHWPGTGFTSSQKTTTTTEVTQPSNAKKVTTTVEDQPAKTLWDWLPLLIQLLGALAIPIVVAVGTAVFATRQTQISEENRKQQHDTDLQIAENQQQEELLRTYFDKISELLLDKEQSTNPNIQAIVRARTLATLHILNTERKTIVLRFLHDSAFLQHVKSFLYSLDLNHTNLNSIDLSEANLSYANLNRVNLNSANLSGADLSYANLNRVNLNRVNLNRANLSYAYLSGADLNRANLSGADLSEASLSGADLSGADLSGADLSGADLSGADLSGASITTKQLEKARNITPKHLAQIKPSKPAVPHEATTAHPSATLAQLEIQPAQTSQEEAEQHTHTQPKQGTDASR